MTKIIMRGQVQDGSSHHEIKTKRTSFINVLCKLQRGILIFGGVMFVIWFFITYGSQNYANPSETIIALKRVKGSEMENFQEEILLSGMLKDQVIPIHYNLTLQLFMPPEYNFTTKGEVNILMECKEKTKMIVLHARDLTVEEAKITNVKNYQDSPLNAANISQLSEKHLVFFKFEEPLRKGSYYILDISFNGIINNQSAGLYRSDYQLKDSNVSTWIASTQLQPSDARRVFPCFDEPGMKSTFEAHIIRKRDTVTLSNMPSLKTETLDDYWELVSFNVTPRMSSYLLAFVVGDLAPYSEERNQGVQVWSRPDMVQFGGYAYDITGHMLQFFSEYFQLPYTMPKTDLVAIPKFPAAMENWGLITFTESALLFDPERSSTDSKVFITMVIAHELAHQWFGNLVTPAWWDQLWLSEGFASYYEYIAIDAIRPEWNIISHFIGTIYEVMESDSLPSTRAMASPVKANEALLSFDDITYLKGGAIVYMLQNFLGERTFLRGLRNYMHKYSFENVKEEYLFQNLNLWNKAQIDVQEVMRTWTKQKGYPVITIVRNYSNKFATVSQAAFVSDDYEDTIENTLEEGFSVTGNKDGRTWIIPVPFTNGQELDWSTKPDYWLKSESGIMKNMPEENTWIIANIKQVGYYRVNYDVKNWNMLIAQLLENHTVIHPINRAQIINDAMQLARSGTLDYTIALNTTQYLSNEEDYLPWQAAFTVFRFLDRRISNTESYDTWKAYVKMQTSNLYENLGWTNGSSDESVLTKYLRKNILKWNCRYGHEDCIQTARKMFRDWKNGTTTSNLTMSLDDREVVLCTGIAEGTLKDWEWMWNKYLREDFKTEKNLLLKSLACTKEIRLLEKLLSMVLKDDGDIPIEDADEAIVYVADNLHATDLVYDFFKAHSEEILLRFSGVPLTNVVERMTAPLYSPKQIAEMGNILKRRDSTNVAVRRLVKIGLHKAQSNLHWMKHRYDQVSIWLNENVVRQ